jgi:hypothetical protein
MEAAPLKTLWPSDGVDDEEPEPSGPPEPRDAPLELPDDPSAEHGDDAAWQKVVLKTRILGTLLLAAGVALGSIGLRVFRRQRYFVVCRTRDAMMRIPVDGKVQQDIILATLQAVT